MVPVNIGPESADLSFAAYAVLGDDHNIYVTLINRSHGPTASDLQIAIGTHADGYTRGEIIRLTAPGGDVSLKTGVTLGGAEITDDAKWDGVWQPLPAPSEKSQFQLVVDLPAASAAVVKLTPK